MLSNDEKEIHRIWERVREVEEASDDRWSEIKDDRKATAERFADLERAVSSLGMQIARCVSATAQLFPKEDAPDVLSFLTYCDGALCCSPDGEMQMSFPEDTPVPLDDLRTAIALLLAHDPKGKVDISYDGGVVVRLHPAPKEVGA